MAEKKEREPRKTAGEDEKQPYEAPQVESIQLSREAAEALT